ncbi:hypothetical protein Desor_3099 [Desulfosporosinus orientis DSM 765]|uniref:Uncharacterized protein n=1 Tax=Desulfosporosinus orientis (strain ATCC 19365 / DSM 765 / NCIMB 8382 / VKM B-1628 / Singapore I) TaxID=768706 RepID=G7W6I0_DESOD|nr:hypothetical protein [Desulfosporosinus orientis]AET68618.1 hypothetical protein Desor_3099 [Desulfosporosinus orientis DSM 765]
MKYEEFFNDNKFKMANDKIKMLISNLIKIFDKKCIKEFYPAWRGDEGDTKVFVLKLQERLKSKYGKKRENIITVRLRFSQLDIEVFNGIYCNGNEFSCNSNFTDSDLTRLYKDINNSFSSRIINE